MIIGPVAKDLLCLGTEPERVALATAFYSKGLLEQISIKCLKLQIFVRLDLTSIEDWARGLVAPDALLRLVERHEANGTSVRIFIHGQAHAKLYVCDTSCLVGSANLTLRGFSGFGHELLWLEDNAKSVSAMWKSLEIYKSYSGKFGQLN